LPENDERPSVESRPPDECEPPKEWLPKILGPRAVVLHADPHAGPLEAGAVRSPIRRWARVRPDPPAP
jgi:hypothetical protein